MKTVLLLLLLVPAITWAQVYKITPADLQRKQSFLLLRDGSVVHGQVLRQDSTLITVRRRGGDMSFVEADQVVRIMAVRPEVPAGIIQYRPVGYNRVFVLKDGSQVEGQFVRRDSTMITVRKRNGQLTYFEPEQLMRMDSVAADTYRDTNRVFRNRFSPWLLTGVTAYMPEKGRFYYRNTWLLLNEFQYGITSFWSVGAKFITPLPYLELADGYYGSGQYRGNSSQLITKFSAAISPAFRLGLNASFQPDYRSTYPSTGGKWTFQGQATVGSSQRNVTVSYGIVAPKTKLFYYVYQPPVSSAAPQYTYVSVPNRSFVSVGVMQKIGPSLTFLSDNSINLGQQTSYADNTGGRASLSAALRIDRQRHAFDLGFYTLIYQKPFLWENGRHTRFFPYIGYNLLIGHN